MEIINKGSYTSHRFRTAYLLLKCDEGEDSAKSTNEQISKVPNVGMRTIDRFKTRFVEDGLDSVLERKPSEREYEKKM